MTRNTKRTYSSSTPASDGSIEKILRWFPACRQAGRLRSNNSSPAVGGTGRQARIIKLLIGFFILYLGLIVYTNRGIYGKPFDAAYWNDRFEHSQWRLPLSIRTIGDDGLYLAEGYRLIRGGDPTTVNAEMPPLGKYFIGLCIKLFGNGNVYGLMMTVSALILFFLFTRKIFAGNTIPALLVTLLLATDPLISNQFALTMLDSQQLLFLLAVFWACLHIRPTTEHTHNVLWSVVAGISLGLFAATKAPLFTLFIIVGAFFVILAVKKPLKLMLVLLASACTSYITCYAQYFVLGHTLIDWLKIQKWIVAFYTGSSLKAIVGNSLTTLLAGYSRNLYTFDWQRTDFWSGTWPVITILWFIYLLKSRDRMARALGITTALLFIVFTFIPFWSRYLVLILPFLYLSTMRVIMHIRTRTARTVLFGALLFINLTVTVPSLFPSPAGVIQQFSYNLQNGFFQDMYEDLSPDSQTVDRQEFYRIGQTFRSQAEIEYTEITVSPDRLSKFINPQYVDMTLVHHTRNLGSFTEHTKFTVVKNHGVWNVVWDWDNYIAGLNPSVNLATSVSWARRGSILASDKKELALDVSSAMVWITPMFVDTAREQEMLKTLEGLFAGRVAAVSFHQRYVGNTLSDTPIPLGVIPFEPDTSIINKLLAYPGISLTFQPGREERVSTIVTVGSLANTQYFECCSHLYSTTAYDGVDGIEQRHNETLKGTNGGSLVITEADGTIVRAILVKEKVDGNDVRL